MLVYTSITKSYLPKARVLAKSIKALHPAWTFVLLFSDSLPLDFDLSNEPFDEVLMIDNLEIENLDTWIFGHSVVELCTAVKGPAAEILSRRGSVDKIMYLDPDIKVFNSLIQIDELLEKYDVLLTPHLLDIENDLSSIEDNEISALKHGVYNLGFFAAKTSGQGLGFINWWAKRLKHYCFDEVPSGLFTDQRWCDLAPAFFSNLHIIRDRGFNVATWNIAHRPITRSSYGELLAGDVPLRFYHFTGYDSGDGLGMLKKYASNQPAALEMWRDYGNNLLIEGSGQKNLKDWQYGFFVDKTPITLDMRKLYRRRFDLQSAFPSPYGDDGLRFLEWWHAEFRGGISEDAQLNMPKKTLVKNIQIILNKLINK